jgi:hypothetical protein
MENMDFAVCLWKYSIYREIEMAGGKNMIFAYTLGFNMKPAIQITA